MEKNEEKRHNLVLRIKQIVHKWRDVRDHNDMTGLQAIRDELSDLLLDVGELESEYESILRIKEQEEKECLDQAMIDIKEKYKDQKVSVEQLKTEARLECKDVAREVIKANSDYRYVRTLTARCDQILNSVASAIKVILKID